MKIVTAFDSFKGCMTAYEACKAAEASIKKVNQNAQIINLPMSDGGEGLVECIAHALPLTVHQVKVHGPLMTPVTTCYAISPDKKTAYMEMAQAAGLTLVPKEKRNPMLTTTYGVGEMILDAISKGCDHIIIGIGGSATCDGGKGMVDCLKEAAARNNAVSETAFIEATAKEAVIKGIRVTIASDVNNPLCGENGAAHVFGPQKGATPEQVTMLDQRLRQFAIDTANAGIAPLSLMDAPGAGAAGGLGFALMAYLKATMRSGIGLLLDLIEFDKKISNADIILTGEGKSDRQTLMGKVAAGVLARAQKQGIPCYLISGQIEDKAELLKAGFADCISINENDSRPLEQLLQKSTAIKNISNTISQLDWYQKIQ